MRERLLKALEALLEHPVWLVVALVALFFFTFTLLPPNYALASVFGVSFLLLAAAP